MDWLYRISPNIHLVWHGLWNPGTVEMERKLYDHELVVVRRGKCKVVISGRSFSCDAGSYLIIPPGETHATYTALGENVYRYCIHFDWAYQGPLLKRPPYIYLPGSLSSSAVHRAPSFVPRRIFYGHIPEDGKIISLLETLSFNWILHHDGELLCRAWLLELLVMLLGDPPPASAAHRSFHLALKIKDTLDQSICKNETIKQRLDAIGYSYEHLSRIFHRHFSMTMVCYLNRIKLENAKQLLMSRKYNISEIAYKLGYNTPRYFSRLFKAQTGITPQQFAD